MVTAIDDETVSGKETGGIAPAQPAKATRIMIIRHAEKPAKSGPPYGVDWDGAPHPDSLSPRGWQRGGALATFFAPSRGALQSPAISVPQYIFACGKEKERDRLRPLQTVTLLGEKLGIAVDTTFVKGEEARLAERAMALSGVVLISWEHRNIHLIANHILGDSTRAPQHWPEERFDIVWICDLSEGVYRFRQLPQLLMPGDREELF
jgi:broad specificity phosphatase PhoE